MIFNFFRIIVLNLCIVFLTLLSKMYKGGLKHDILNWVYKLKLSKSSQMKNMIRNYFIMAATVWIVAILLLTLLIFS